VRVRINRLYTMPVNPSPSSLKAHARIVDLWQRGCARLHRIHLSVMQVLVGIFAFLLLVFSALALANWAGFAPGVLWGADNNALALRNQLLQLHERIEAMQALKDQYASLANPLPAQLGKVSQERIAPANNLLFSPIDSSQPADLLPVAIAMNERLAIAEQQWLSELRVLHQLPTGVPVAQHKGMSSDYGTRIDPFTKTLTHHAGIDFKAEHGTPIVATGDGIVTKVDVDRHNGQYVDIEHASGFTTRYAHVSRFAVKAGETVKRGQVIANVGNTGRSTSPHLHYEIRFQGIPINPLQALVPKANPQVASSSLPASN
jgi:murein DD-endopeptidase MepM/ murein hydrolase activator NlpD